MHGQGGLIANVINAEITVPSESAVGKERPDSLPIEAQRAFVKALANLIRTRYDDNQYTAAEKLGFSQPYISQLLSMKRSPGIAFLLRVSVKTGLSIDELIGRPSSRPPPEGGEDGGRSRFERELAQMRADIDRLTAAAPAPPPTPLPTTRRRRRS